MNFNRTLAQTDIYFLATFVVLYLLFLARTFYIARQVRSTARAVVIKLAMRSMAFGLLILALLDPSFGQIQDEALASGRDIYLVVDVSKSMEATDVQPSRLEKTKFELLKMLEVFATDRIGLVIFASDAVVESPLTFDKAALKIFIESLNTNLIAESGSALKPALEVVLRKYSKQREGIKTTANVVVLTDGEDFGEELSPILRSFSQYGINLFLMGVGTEKGSRLLAGNTYLTDAQGQVVISKLKKEYLQKLAADGKGQYFEITDKQNQIGELCGAIKSSKNVVIDRQKVDVQANKYYYFLALALFLVVLDVLFSVRTIRL